MPYLLRPVDMKLIFSRKPKQVFDHLRIDVSDFTLKYSKQQDWFGGSQGTYETTENRDHRLANSPIPRVDVGNINHAGLVSPNFCEQLDYSGLGRLG